MKIKKGYHAVYEESYFRGIDDAEKYGFDFAQFELGVPENFLHEIPRDKLIDIGKYAQSKGIELSFHAPADNIGLFYDYPMIRKSVIDQFREILGLAEIIGGRHMTFHAGTYSKFKRTGEMADDTRGEYYENILYENLKALLDSSSFMVCIENDSLDNTARRAMQRVINDTGRLYLALDTAKLYKSEGNIIKDDLDFFRKNREFIRELHIHDKNVTFGSHQTVGSGYVDFTIFREFINENTYLNFEVRPVEAAKESMERLHEILEDI